MTQTFDSDGAGHTTVASPRGGPNPSHAATLDDGQPAAGSGGPTGRRPTGTANPAAAKRRGRLGWDILLGLDVTMLGVTLILGIVAFLASDSGTPEVTKASIWLNIAAAMVLMGVIPFVWAWGTRRGGFRGALVYLGMFKPGRSLLHGTGLGVVLIIGLYLLLRIAIATGLLDTESTEGGTLDSVLEHLDWWLVVAIALSAGIGEEIFFRGLLQKPLRWWGQAILFGLFHAAGGSWLQILFTAGIGFLFGWLRERNVSLVTLIVAHAMYDFILLAAYLGVEG